jgi:putative SOS response-associated peptidase YedK
VFVGRDAVDIWFHAGLGEVREALDVWPEVALQAYKVSTAVNNPRSDGANLIERVDT